MNLRFWIWDLLPDIFKELDTYKDSNGRGLFERYCEVFGWEIDEQVIPKIENYTENLDILICEEKFIKHLAYTMGQPPNFFNSIPLYRRILSFIISLYKIKGTLKAYQVFFGYMGYQIYLSLGKDECTLYDDPTVFYDNNERYDTCCLPCVEYTIVVSKPGSNCLPSANPDDSVWDLNSFEVPEAFRKILCFIEPIDLMLAGYVPGIFACELIKVKALESVEVNFLLPLYYDVPGVDYDAPAIDYDKFTITPIYIYP